ncbi:MAG: hypothetical protein PVS2B2_25320 [Candidatus Acidiferrum sp.]
MKGFAFKSPGARSAAFWLLYVLIAVPAITVEAQPASAKLRPGALAAFQEYVRLTDARHQAEAKQLNLWLWPESLPANERDESFAALKNGQVKMKRLETLRNGAAIDCPGGMIHHWVGLAFIPGAKLDDVLEVLKDYNQQSVYYAPDVERSRIESREGDRFRVFLRFRRHKFITVVLNTEHEVEYFRDGPTRAHSRSSAVRITQVENPGTDEEREKPPGNDDGFLWRMETWWRIEERDGGVYVQSEVASLTRDIPTGLGWLVGPFVTSVPKESLTFTLEATRKAVTKRISMRSSSCGEQSNPADGPYRAKIRSGCGVFISQGLK